jgi:hypothetical protein
VYKYLEPNYNLVQIRTGGDTISFPLDADTYNSIKSFNLFVEDSIEYISFYDRRSETINIYNFWTGTLKKKINLKECFKNRKLYNTTVYTKCFDSIYLTNELALYLIDTSYSFIDSIPFLEKPFIVRPSFENSTPPIIRGQTLYAKARPYLKETSQKDLRKWRTIYSFNIENHQKELHYPLPETYRNNIFGYYFFNYSYCYNHKNNMVFSFPADSNIYETDLKAYNMEYFGKSKLQTKHIEAVSKQDIATGESLYRSYALRDSYGSIYYDPHNKRYLRVAKSKISYEDYKRKNFKRKQRLIIFDEQFKIIGESPVDSEISLSSLLFTSNGRIYARTNAKDEYALHFVRLIYENN